MATAMWKMSVIGLCALGLMACAEGDQVDNDGEPLGEPSLAVSGADALAWELDVGASGDREVEIENRGDRVLEVELSAEASWLSASTSSLEVAPGDRAVVEFEASCGERPLNEESRVEVTSNDPSRPSLEWDALLRCEALAGGELEVVVEGLDGDEEAQISITGPQGFETSASGSEVLADLEVGTYAVVAETVGESALFEPTPVEQEVEVESEQRALAEIDYQAVPGSVEVTVEGLPSGVDPEIELRREGQFWDVPADGIVDELKPGIYDVRTFEIEESGVLYQASDLEVLVESDQRSEVMVQYIIDPGSLDVTVNGLPDGVSHDVDVIGPEGGETSLPQEGSLSALSPGVYEVVPNPVEVGPARYEGEAQTVEVLSDQTATATVDYEVVVGGLEIALQGLPVGVSPIIDISGPDGDSTHVGETTIDEAMPGDYTIEFSSVDEGNSTYSPMESTVEVVVESDEITTVQMDYELDTGALSVEVNGLPTGVEHDIEVVDDSGGTTSLPQGGEVSSLEPGSYDLVPADVQDGPALYEAQQKTVEVSSGETATATIDYEVIVGGLEVILDGLEAGVEPLAVVEGPQGFSEDLVGGGLLGDLVPGEYTVDFQTLDQGGATYLPDDSSLSVTVESGDTAQVSTTYQVVGLSLEVSIGGDDLSVEFKISGPEGFSEVVTGSANFGDVEPGTYSIEAVEIPVDEWGNELDVSIDPGDEVVVDTESKSWDIEVLKPTVVRSESDSGQGSLRDVVGSDLAAGSVITFDDGVSSLSLDGGPISVDGDIAIEADGFGEVLVDAAGQNRHFEVQNGVTLSLFGLRLVDGFSDDDGGSVWVDTDGILIVEQSDWWLNEAGGDGGALFLEDGAEALIVDSWLDGNTAGGHGGAVATVQFGGLSEVSIWRSSVENNESGTHGGAIYYNGQLELEATSIFNNQAGSNGGGIYGWEGVGSAIDSTVAMNHADGEGGGIWFWADDSTTFSIKRSVVADNSADAGGADMDRFSTTSDMESLGHNVVGISGAGLGDGWATDEVGDEDGPVDAHLQGPLIEDGFTPVLPLGDNSPARSMIDAVDCVGEDEDWWRLDQQRRYRPAGATCSAGAWEVGSHRERFEEADMSLISYDTGSFVGAGGVSWDYDNVRRTEPDEGQAGDYYIDGTGVILHGDNDSTLSADGVSGGIASLSLLLSQAFESDGERRVKVYIDGVEVGESADVSIDTDTETAPYPVTIMAIDDLDVSSDFDLQIEATGTRQVVVDHISWR